MSRLVCVCFRCEKNGSLLPSLSTPRVKLRTRYLPWNPSAHRCKRRRRAPEAQTFNMSRRISSFATHVPLIATSAGGNRGNGGGGDAASDGMQPSVLHIRPRKLTVAENGKVYVGSQQGAPRCVVHRQFYSFNLQPPVVRLQLGTELADSCM